MGLHKVGMAFQDKGIAAARGVNGFGGRGHKGGEVAAFGCFLQVEAGVVNEFGLGKADGGGRIEEGNGEVNELWGFDCVNGGEVVNRFPTVLEGVVEVGMVVVGVEAIGVAQGGEVKGFVEHRAGRLKPRLPTVGKALFGEMQMEYHRTKVKDGFMDAEGAV